MKNCCLMKAAAIVLVMATGLVPGIAWAELTVGSPFTDNAVLQRDQPVLVWGEADAGATVTLEFAGQKKTAFADSSKQWEITLDPMPASSTPRSMTVSSSIGNQQLSIGNVVVGEVWICSGQSNMHMGHKQAPEVNALVPTAKNIRSFSVHRIVAFTEQNACQGQWVEQIPDSAVAFAFAYSLEEITEVPVGIILTCWGSSSLEAWMPRDMTETVPHFQTMMEEFDADTETCARISSILNGPRPWSGQDDVFLRRQSNILYNAMMHPLAPYACRGLVWYQGERNTQSMFGMLEEPWYSRNTGMLKYGDTLKQWVQRYRTEWSNDEMHFMVVMLPGYYKPQNTGPQLGAEHPTAHSWAWMRESQLKVLDLPHTSVVNTIDLGDEKNIHPKDKLPIGQRLALLVARNALGQEIEAQGPVMKTVIRHGDRLVVHFDNAEGLKTTDGNAPTAFWISGDSEKWVRAEAELNGQTVVLSCPELKNPRFVRYAFAGKPNVNLVNRADLPAYPFRTDAFAP
jgi:sialate O-acetylesterase